ncbi:MAG: insulinase family protein [Gemmatimonadaceae bacterium]|nr:insulinase family protein [Gemmatimonadaceae bacterium]
MSRAHLARHAATAVGATLFAVASATSPAPAQPAVRERPPALGSAAPLTVPAVHRERLANGLALSVVEQRELPLVQLVVSFPGGARLDAANAGIAAFTANMLDEGAGTRDAATLQSELAFLGASLQTGADWDRITVSLKVPVRSLAPALDLLADVIRRPTFASAEVKRQRDLRLTAILQQRDQPNALADIAFNSTLFPTGHPYHRNAGGDSATVAAIDSSAVRNFYARALRPEHAQVVVVGDIAAERARAELQRRLGDWRAAGAPAVAAAVTTAPRREVRTRVYLVDKPGAAQSVISIGWPGVDRLSPDYAPLMVMNTLLGGSFSSRLNSNLREAKGYTYGASSRFTFRKLPGPFIASAAVRTNVTDSSLVEFFKELRAIRDQPVSNDELQRAKAYVELALPGSLESTSQVAGAIAQLAVFDLPLAELSTYAAKVRRVTTADVQRVARQYLHPDQASVIVVGDLNSVRPSIEALKLGEIVVLDLAALTR